MTLLWMFQTSTITDQVTSVITISPSSPQHQQLNTRDPATLPEQPRSFNNHQTKDSLDSFETLRGYLNQFKSNIIQEKEPSTTTTTSTPPTTTPVDVLKKHLGRRKNLYKARFFSPNKDFIKQQISSSLYGPSEVTLEPSFHISSSSSVSSSLVIETSPITGHTSVQSIIINVASSVRVETAETSNHVEIRDESSAIVSDAPVSPVSSSVVTLFLSGSVPGVFSTSLSTLYYPGVSGHDSPTEMINPTRTVKL